MSTREYAQRASLKAPRILAFFASVSKMRRMETPWGMLLLPTPMDSAEESPWPPPPGAAQAQPLAARLRRPCAGSLAATSAMALLPSRCATALTGHEGAALCVRFNKDGGYCLSGGADRTVRLWAPSVGRWLY